MRRARLMWQALEPYHAVTYFAPESKQATDALGCKGGWMSYFGLRAAPLGAAPAELVTATFYNFHPDRVGRAIPAAWEAAAPADFLAARARSVDAALRRLLGDAVESAEIAEAAELAREAALAAPTAGRPLAAANAPLDWPDRPHLVLWHAQTLLRESRGDGHVAALVSGGLDPCEALVAFAADGRAVPERLRGARGWSEQEWAQACGRLERRGLLNPDGTLTGDGAALRSWVEERTDRGAAPSWAALGEERCDRLVELAGSLVEVIVDNGGFLQDNPMGLRTLV
ncbi:SCO6745 family protein [Pseudonocardia acaciae]|uniref:SCO6745 family protein n=1 Tax=Pseudonocardia acaciae TaxID=551276 RepID=UPI00048C9F13|nr:hypothetical protein [Pseudonocardia acaciae]